MKKNIILVTVCSLFLGAMSSGVLADSPYRHSPNEHNQIMTKVTNSSGSVFDDVSSHASDGVAKIDSKDKEASNLNEEFYDCISVLEDHDTEDQEEFYDCISVLEDYDTRNQESASSKEVSILDTHGIDRGVQKKTNLYYIQINSSSKMFLKFIKSTVELCGGHVFAGNNYVIISIPSIPERLKRLIPSDEVSILNIANIDKIIKPKSSEESAKLEELNTQTISDILLKVNDSVRNKTIFKNLLQEKGLSSNDTYFIQINSSNSKLIDVLKGVAEIYGGIVFTGTGYVIIAVPHIPEVLEVLDKLGFKFMQDIPPVPEPVKDMVNKFSKQITSIGEWVADLGKKLFKRGWQRSKDALKQNKGEKVGDDVVSNNEAINVFSKVESEPDLTDSRLTKGINVIKKSIKSWFKKNKNKPVLTES